LSDAKKLQKIDENDAVPHCGSDPNIESAIASHLFINFLNRILIFLLAR
jgi:hypothetical protein